MLKRKKKKRRKKRKRKSSRRNSRNRNLKKTPKNKMLKRWMSLLINSCQSRKQSERSMIVRFSERLPRRSLLSRSRMSRALLMISLARTNKNKINKQKSRIRSHRTKKTVVTPLVASINPSRLQMRLLSTLDSLSLRKRTKVNSRNTMKKRKRMPSKFVNRMLNKKPKRRSNVKKSRRRRRKNNPNVMKK
jgi:hypothetical protein